MAVVSQERGSEIRERHPRPLPLLHVADKSHFLAYEVATDWITPGDAAWNFRVPRYAISACTGAQLRSVSCRASAPVRGWTSRR